MKYFVQAPVRISLFGGGTDVGEYADKYGGVCINMAINIHQEFTFNTEDKGFYIPPKASIKFYQTFLDEFDVKARIEQNFDGYIHGGLGTSASAAVCMVAGLSKIKGENLTRYEIAEKAWNIEVNKCGLFGGRQDQFAATFGGFNLMKFEDRVEIQSIYRGAAENVAKHLLLFDTGIRRKDTKLQENLKIITSEQKEALDVIKSLANDAYHRIYKGDIKGLGRLLNDTWNYKKKSNKVSTPEIDNIYNKAMELGALGGKCCGSGGGGYMIFLADEKQHGYLKENLGIRFVDHGGINWTGVVVREL